MLVPSIFSDNFFDDFFEFPFIDDRAEKNAERKPVSYTHLRMSLSPLRGKQMVQISGRIPKRSTILHCCLLHLALIGIVKML